ncbi:MAG: LysE family translocator [Alphaproteobacteria bacterium]|nr:LysE family translocator [Alphaproteobacteria bacterium]MBL7099158.1 LysE family translocator [Alphaproteobacteria bacterium]
MDALHAIAGFTVAAALLVITPGLDTALVLRTAAVEGPKRAIQAGLGTVLGCLTWALVVSLGLGALLAASQVAYNALRVAGALYMGWLGLKMIAAAVRGDAAMPAFAETGGTRSWIRRGFLTNILNPKVGAFYVSLLPLFIPPHVNVVGFSLLLASILSLEGLLWFWMLTVLVTPLANWIRRRSVTRALDGVTGGVLVAAGAGLFLSRR